MNILITYLSLYGNSAKRLYNTNGLCSESEIEASQTNEPVLRLLKKHLEEKGQRINKIIPVLSYEAENDKCNAMPEITTYEFFKSLTEEVVGTQDILFPVREYSAKNTLRETGAVISEICDSITVDDHIYIDTSGGTRTSANMLQLLTKILEYKGCKMAASFYSNINVNPAVIQTTNDFTDLTMLADAINEFVHTGRSYQLSQCFKNETHEEITELIKYMDEFTDRMQLCNIAELDDTLINMRRQIEKVRMIKSDDTKLVILGNLLPVIENKFFNGNSDSIDYCRMIKWCLENGLVQQAVTIYIEKMPKYIFDNRILICDKAFYDKTKEKNAYDPTKQNTDAYIFYEVFMDSFLYTNKMTVKKVKEALNEIFIDNTPRSNYEENIKKYILIFTRIQNSTMDGFINNKANRKPSNKDSTEGRVADFIKAHKCTRFKVLINQLCSDEQALAEVIGINLIKQNTIDKKLNTAANITEEKYICEGVTINSETKRDELSNILFDYIYVKSVRNHINHASNEDNLNEEQKVVLEKIGYNVREFNTKVICSIIKASVKRIEKAAAAIQTI